MAIERMQRRQFDWWGAALDWIQGGKKLFKIFKVFMNIHEYSCLGYDLV
jgi:hypothetical protein